MAEGIIHAFLLDGAGSGRRLDWQEVRSWQPGQGLLWLHLDLNDAAARAWIERESGLEEVAQEAILAAETRPRAISIGEGLVVALRGVNLNPGAEPEDMVAIRGWFEAGRVITARHRRLLSVEDLVAAVEAGKGPETSAGLLVELADRLVQRMEHVIGQAEDSAAELEEAVLAEESRDVRTELASLRRQSISLRRYLAPQREALGRLQVEKAPWLTDADRLRLREVNDALVRHIECLDAVRERTSVTQDELVSHLSDQLNRRMYVLSVVAAVFLPLGFLTGLLGINVAGIPGAEYPKAFMVFTLGLFVLVALLVWLFRWKRWL
jgi:zinc transporter